MTRTARVKWVVLGLIAGMSLIYFVGTSIRAGHRRYRHCILCRVLRIEHRYCGIEWEELLDNECTRWFQQAVPEHEHLWVSSSTPATEQNLFGATYGWASNVGNRPATRLTPDEQLAVYRHIDDLKESTELFIEIRNCVLRNDFKGDFLSLELKYWAETDQFKTPWPVWKERMLAAWERSAQ